MLTKSVKSVISVVLKHVAQAKKSVQSVRSVSDSNILPSGKTPMHKQPGTDNATTKRNHKTLPLMGATRLASGKKKSISNSKQSLVNADSSLLAPRDASPPLVVAFCSSVSQ